MCLVRPCIGIKKYPCCRRVFSFVCIIIKQIVNYWYMIMTNDMYINIEIWVKIRGKNSKIFLCTKKNVLRIEHFVTFTSLFSTLFDNVLHHETMDIENVSFSITRNSSKFVIVTFICYLLNYVTLFCTCTDRAV